MKITEVYDKYKISPMLQLHQLRVAGVASLTCDKFKKPLDNNSIITACLLHDMGNILKFNFDIFPDEFFSPEGKDYWRKTKEEFKQKYGDEEHEATYKIAKELGVSKEATKILKSIGFSQSSETWKNNDFAIKITAYSDMRVAPTKVTSMKERLKEAKKRYVYQTKKWTEEKFDHNKNYWTQIEQQIFEHCSIKPEDITDESVNSLIEGLRGFEVKTD